MIASSFSPWTSSIKLLTLTSSICVIRSYGCSPAASAAPPGSTSLMRHPSKPAPLNESLVIPGRLPTAPEEENSAGVARQSSSDPTRTMSGDVVDLEIGRISNPLEMPEVVARPFPAAGDDDLLNHLRSGREYCPLASNCSSINSRSGRS